MFTDMVGYSALVRKNESLAMDLLDEHRRIVRKRVPGFGGREVETAGDSFLIEFSSALEAMHCAIAVQKLHAEHNKAAAFERAIEIRIGLHVGDIEHRKGGKVFGDGVNLAARIEPLAPHGGIALSTQLHAQVRHRLQAPFRSLGAQTLKNIAEPMEVFVLDATTIAALPTPEARSRLASLHLDWRWAVMAMLLLALPLAAYLWRQGGPKSLDKSVAVLPFANLSDDKANAYFADGMQDEILTALSRIKALKVIARSSVEQYRDKPRDVAGIGAALGVGTLLEGSVQRAGGRVRINVQLINTRDAAHVWAETYDRELADVFAVQSDVARQVAQALQASLLPAEASAIAVVPTHNPKAYDLYLQANAFMRRAWDQTDFSGTLAPQAIALYDQALAEDPGFALAEAERARAQLLMYVRKNRLVVPAAETAAWLAAAKASAERALAQQPNLAEAHFALGMYNFFDYRDLATAREQFELARRAQPNNPAVLGLLAVLDRIRGHWDAAVDAFTEAAARNPQDEAAWDDLAHTQLALRRYSDADESYGRGIAVARDPTELQLARAWAKVLWKGDLEPLRAVFKALPPAATSLYAYQAYLYDLSMLSRDYDGALNAAAGMLLPFNKSLRLGHAYQLKGERGLARRSFEEALRVLQAALKEDPDSSSLHRRLGLAYAGLGQREEAVAEARAAVARRPVSKDASTGPYYLVDLAEVYVEVGDHDHALEALRQLLEIPAGHVLSQALLKLDPVWDPLRNDPRFQKLIAHNAPKT
jgi:TolB-like protein/class 3 adenylate cyclase/Flp pilus assembly protein TadD